jgi:hypothetical protein
MKGVLLLGCWLVLVGAAVARSSEWRRRAGAGVERRCRCDGVSACGGSTATVAANPLGNYRVEESRLAYRRILASGVAAADAKKWWFLGDFRKAFAYMENWPITVTQAPLGSEADFVSDIVLRFKASERGAAAVMNPRYVVKCVG